MDKLTLFRECFSERYAFNPQETRETILETVSWLISRKLRYHPSGFGGHCFASDVGVVTFDGVPANNVGTLGSFSYAFYFPESEDAALHGSELPDGSKTAYSGRMHPMAFNIEKVNYLLAVACKNAEIETIVIRNGHTPVSV